MTPEQTRSERERAHETFTKVTHAHVASIQALGVVAALPDACSLIAAKQQVRSALRGDGRTDGFAAQADMVVKYVQEMHESKFETMWQMALISLCGALEYLVKAVFVDQAAHDQAKAAALIEDVKLNLKASDVLGLPVTEQWFIIADALFKELGKRHPQFYQRCTCMLQDYSALQLPAVQREHLETALGASEIKNINEAFLVRNCLVHNGGRVSAALAKAKGLERNSLIQLDRDYALALIVPIIRFAECINSVWSATLMLE